MHSVLSRFRSRFLGLLRAKTRLSTASSDGVKASLCLHQLRAARLGWGAEAG